MKTIPISELENRIDALLAAGLDEPVELTRAGEVIGYFISTSYAKTLSNALLTQDLFEARAEGFIGTEASKALLDRFRQPFSHKEQ